MLAQGAVGHGVERAAGHAAGLVPDAGQAGVAAFDHLPCRAAGEGEQQDALRGDAIGHDARHPGTERGGLTGARAGEHPQRSAVELRDRSLLVVESFEETVCVHVFENSR